MSRSGDFFDQDAAPVDAGGAAAPDRAGRGMLYDQDRRLDPTRADAAPRARRRRGRDPGPWRQARLEFELGQPDDEPDAEPSDEPVEPGAGLVRISSRPGDGAYRRGLGPPLLPGPPPAASWADVPLPEPPSGEFIAASPALPVAPSGQRARRQGTDSAAGTSPPAPASQSPPAGTASPARPAARPPSRPGRNPPTNRATSTSPAPSTGLPTSTSRATAILAAGTFASRLTGFLRVLTIGYVLGVTSLSDAFNYANGIPNIIYDLVLGGILSATLIPVFVDQLRGDDDAANMRAISAVVTAILAALVAITAVLWLLAPAVIHLYLLLNPAATGAAERALGTRLLHFFAPQVLFLGAIVVSTALLNARRNFTAAAFSPVANNLIAIGALLATKAVASGILSARSADPVGVLERLTRDQHAIWVLGIGTTAGYVVQLLVQLPAMHRVGYRLRPVWDLHHPAVRRVAQLSSWLVGVVVANQVALALVMILAGKVSGGVTAYQFSYQFFQLPYALIVVSIATALMPDLAERWVVRDRRGFERQFVLGFRVAMAVIVPVGFVYAAVAQPFIQLAVYHGRVTASGAHLVASCLAIFAVGLPGFSAYFLLIRLYQAMQNARMMFWIYLLENALTVVAALALDPLFGVPGLVAAWVGPYTIAAIIATYDLRRRVGSLGGVYTVRALARILVASGITVGAAVAVGQLFPAHGRDAVLIGRLVAQVGVGTAVYLGLAHLLGIKELQPVMRLGRRLTAG